MTKLYQPFLINNFRVIFMDIPSAEMTKYAANAMLATRISFMNDIANLCETCRSKRRPCAQRYRCRHPYRPEVFVCRLRLWGVLFSKDVKALIHTGIDNGYHMEIIEAVEHVNEKQKSIVYDKLISLIGNVKDKTIAVLGLAFKPETDDMREAPALVVIDKLLKDGAKIRVFDPIAMPECKRRIGETVIYTENLYDCADGADALLLMTEWRQFRLPTWNVISKMMPGRIIVDGRNIWNRTELEELGYSYTRIGEK